MMTERKPDTDVPVSFNTAMAANYLGSPVVVAALVEAYIKEIVEWVAQRGASTMTAQEMSQLAYARGKHFSAVFSGEDPAYERIQGWNTRVGGLSAVIMADLGHYWQSQRAANDQDPYRVLYAWLVWAVVDALKADDENITNQKMGDRIHKLIRMLTGTTKREGA